MEIHWEHKFSNGGTKEDLCDWGTYFDSVAAEGALGVSEYDRWRIGRYRKGEDGDGFPERLVSNSHMTESQWDIISRGSLGMYFEIWKICAGAFELGIYWIIQMPQILDQIDIYIKNQVWSCSSKNKYRV